MLRVPILRDSPGHLLPSWIDLVVPTVIWLVLIPSRRLGFRRARSWGTLGTSQDHGINERLSEEGQDDWASTKESEPGMIRYLITIALFTHGLGHLLFLANSWGVWKAGDESRSWLFSGVLGAGRTVEGIFGLIWLIPLVGFVAVSRGYLTHQGWWLQLALASA